MGIKAKIARSGWFANHVHYPPETDWERSWQCWMWRAVLDRALVDVMSKNKKHYREAADFFFAPDKEIREWFDKVCLMAALDTDHVLTRVKQIIDRNLKGD